MRTPSVSAAVRVDQKCGHKKHRLGIDSGQLAGPVNPHEGAGFALLALLTEPSGEKRAYLATNSTLFVRRAHWPLP
jgi:hypothetical protein